MSTASAARGAVGRVAATHLQTRRGLLVTVAFLVAAAVATVAADNWWLPLHLFLVGAVLSAVATTTQMLAITWSSSPPTRPWLAIAQRWTLAAGAVGVVVGRDGGSDRLIEIGAALVIVALLAMVPILMAIRRGAVTDRYRPAIDAYLVAHVAGAAGATLGVLLATGRTGTHYVEIRSAHVTINLFGLVGGVIAATLPYFTATQVRSKMNRRATPRAIRVVLAGLGAAVAVAVIGQLTGRPGVAAVALVVYAGALVRVVTLLPIYDPSRWRWTGPRLAQLLCGIAWWTAMTVVYAIEVGRDRLGGTALLTLAIGGFAQILVASLAYLGPVVRGGGQAQLTAGFRATRSWISLAAGNIAALGALLERRSLLLIAVAVWVADIAARAVWLLATNAPATR